MQTYFSQPNTSSANQEVIIVLEGFNIENKLCRAMCLVSFQPISSVFNCKFIHLFTLQLFCFNSPVNLAHYKVTYETYVVWVVWARINYSALLKKPTYERQYSQLAFRERTRSLKLSLCELNFAFFFSLELITPGQEVLNIHCFSIDNIDSQRDAYLLFLK